MTERELARAQVLTLWREANFYAAEAVYHASWKPNYALDFRESAKHNRWRAKKLIVELGL